MQERFRMASRLATRWHPSSRLLRCFGFGCSLRLLVLVLNSKTCMGRRPPQPALSRTADPAPYRAKVCFLYEPGGRPNCKGFANLSQLPLIIQTCNSAPSTVPDLLVLLLGLLRRVPRAPEPRCPAGCEPAGLVICGSVSM